MIKINGSNAVYKQFVGENLNFFSLKVILAAIATLFIELILRFLFQSLSFFYQW